jgi:hypothetical protein
MEEASNSDTDSQDEKKPPRFFEAEQGNKGDCSCDASGERISRFVDNERGQGSDCVC